MNNDGYKTVIHVPGNIREEAWKLKKMGKVKSLEGAYITLMKMGIEVLKKIDERGDSY